MKLTKTDTLFLYKLLYHYSSTVTSLPPDDEDMLTDFLSRLEDSLLGEVTQNASEEEDSESQDSLETCDDVEEMEEPDADVSVDSLVTLSAISVTSLEGNKTSLEFDHSNYADAVDVLLDGGSTLLEEVDYIKIVDGAIDLHSDGKWHSYKLRKKLPASWSKLLEEDTLYGVLGENN